jgi:hypothetical protein
MLSVSVTSGVRQLPDDGRKFDPHVLTFDVAVVSEFDDMEHAELERTILAIRTEGPARHRQPMCCKPLGPSPILLRVRVTDGCDVSPYRKHLPKAHLGPL